MPSTQPAAMTARARAEREAADFLSDGHTVSAVILLLEEGGIASPAPTAPKDLLRTLERFVATGTIDEVPWAGAAWTLLTEAMARIATDGLPDPTKLAQLGLRLGRAPSWAIDRWYERCVQEISGLPEEQRSSALRRFGTEPVVSKGQPAPDQTVAVVPHESAWSLSDPFQLWDEPSVTDSALADLAPLRVLWRMDRERWFRAIEQWADPRLVQGALVAFEGRASLAQLTTLIRSAEPAFDDTGQSTGRVTAIVICSLAVARNRFPDGYESFDEFASHFRQFAEALVNRPDWAPLATALSAWLYRSAALWPQTGTPMSEGHRVAFNALSEVLQARAVPIPEARRFAAQRKSTRDTVAAPWRRALPALLAAAHSLSPGDRKAHMEWLREVLTEADEWRSAQTPDTLIQEVAERLRKETDPVRTCIQLYEELEPDRRRGEFERHAEERECSLPSTLLLLVLGVLVATGAECDILATTRYSTARALRLKLTSVSLIPPYVHPRDALGMGLAAACAQLGPSTPQALELLAPVLGHDDVLARILLQLTPPFRTDLLASLGLSKDEVIRRVNSWAVAEGAAGSALSTALSDAFGDIAS